jgi:hypothetical protein
MPNDSREIRAEAAPLFLAWGLPSLEAQEGSVENLTLWLTGGAILMAWTALSLLLTSA